MIYFVPGMWIEEGCGTPTGCVTIDSSSVVPGSSLSILASATNE